MTEESSSSSSPSTTAATPTPAGATPATTWELPAGIEDDIEQGACVFSSPPERAVWIVHSPLCTAFQCTKREEKAARHDRRNEIAFRTVLIASYTTGMDLFIPTWTKPTNQPAYTTPPFFYFFSLWSLCGILKPNVLLVAITEQIWPVCLLYTTTVFRFVSFACGLSICNFCADNQSTKQNMHSNEKTRQSHPRCRLRSVAHRDASTSDRPKCHHE